MDAMVPKKDFRFEGVVRFTRIGTSFLVFTTAVGFAALNTGNNALYIALTFMLGCLLLSGSASHGGLRDLRIELVTVENAWAGSSSLGWLKIGNRSRIWNIRDVVIASGELARSVSLAMIPRRGETVVPLDFLFRRRGLVRLDRIDLYTRYPFGFFLKKRRVKIQAEVVVYPRLLDKSESRERFLPAAGEHAAGNRPGGGSELHSFREFVRGDSIRQVHWKKSASLGRWIIKQTDLEVARSVHVVVDPWRPAHVSEEAFEEMISAAATFVHEASASGIDVTLTVPPASVRVREGESAEPLFRMLALLDETSEPLALGYDRDAMVFSAGGQRDAATA